MAELKQTAALSYYQGWYGTCTDSDECVELPLIAGTGSSSTKIYPEIRAIYEIRNDTKGAVAYDGETADGFGLSFAPLKSLKCGKCYRILLNPGTGSINLPQFSYANEANDDPEQNIDNRITDNCVAQAAEFEFDAVTSITDELDEGYINSDATIYDAETHSDIITSAKGISELKIKSSGSGLQYRLLGEVDSWTDLTTTEVTLTTNFANLQLRVKEGLQSGNYDQLVTLVAEPENDAYVAITDHLTYNVLVNNVEISASKIITEELEEGTTGTIHSFDIEFENLDGIGVTTNNSDHVIATSSNSVLWGDSLSIPNPSNSTGQITIYVKLDGTMPNTDVSTKLTVIGDRRNSGADITLTDAVTVTSTVAPRPQITELDVDDDTLEVTIDFSNRTNYLGNHWHYRVNKNTSEGELIVPNNGQSYIHVAFDESVTLNQSDFTDAGTYVLTAWIVKGNHQPIDNSDVKTTEFTIASNDATFSVNTSDIYEVLDIDDSQTNHSVSITQKNNLTNISYSASTFDNWEFIGTPNENGFQIKLKDSVKQTDLSASFVDLAEETFIITGDVGDRDTSGDATKSITITLNAKLVDNAEFSLTGPNFNIIDVRNYGVSATEYGPFTVTFDAVNLSSGTLTNWELEFDNDDTWTSTPDFSAIETGTKFRLRNKTTLPGVDATEQLIVTPTAKPSDADDTDDPSPSYRIRLDSVVNPLTASLGNPGTQDLGLITSGDDIPTTSFTVSGSRIQNITITETEDDWKKEIQLAQTQTWIYLWRIILFQILIPVIWNLPQLV